MGSFSFVLFPSFIGISCVGENLLIYLLIIIVSERDIYQKNTHFIVSFYGTFSMVSLSPKFPHFPVSAIHHPVAGLFHLPGQAPQGINPGAGSYTIRSPALLLNNRSSEGDIGLPDKSFGTNYQSIGEVADAVTKHIPGI